MRLVNAINNVTTTLLFSVLLLSATAAVAQENSPYSRYGLGDHLPAAPVVTRGMGGIAAGYADYDSRFDLKLIYPKPQSGNYVNPASYGRIRITTFDIGFEVDKRTLREPNNATKYSSASAILSYVQLAIPLSRKNGLGMTLGLRPTTRINYKIEKLSKEAAANPPFNTIDSATTLFEGAGGSYEAFVGIGKSFKNFSIGVNTGYYFGSKNYSTKKLFRPDSSYNIYNSANYETNTTFGGLFFQAGAQYAIQLKKDVKLTLGAYGNVKQQYNARQDTKRSTFIFSNDGAVITIDSVYYQTGLQGKIQTPAQLGAGFVVEKLDKWLLGADFVTTKWSDYRYYGAKDATQDSWEFKLGGQLTPNPYNAKSYWSRVAYRAGFNVGKDYLKVDNNLPFYNITTGFGLPVRKNPYNNQYSNINLALEYGKRGNNANTIRENYFRVAVGFSLSDLWFVKRKYD
jgi:hypothetical protein